MPLEFVEAVEESVNEMFPPKPGGLVDKFRKKAAEERARQDEETNAAEPIEQRSYRAVKVAQTSPEIFQAITYTIPAGGYAMVLPQSPYRFRATLLVITSGATAILAKDSGNAISGTGFTLPYGVTLPVNSRGQLYAFNNTGSIIQLSVIAELYAPETAR